MKTQSLKLDVIHCDSGTQSRVYINEDAVTEYAERMTEGDKFPPVDVFFDGTDYHLADGFHRVMAAQRSSFKDILANVHKGTAVDALWLSIGANKANGVKRTAGDKRKSIEIALNKFPDKTQEQIASHVGCVQQYVQKVKSELTTSGKLAAPANVKGKDGKTYPSKYKPKPAHTTLPTEKETSRPHEASGEGEGTTQPEPSPRSEDSKWKEALGEETLKDGRQFALLQQDFDASSPKVRFQFLQWVEATYQK